MQGYLDFESSIFLVIRPYFLIGGLKEKSLKEARVYTELQAHYESKRNEVIFDDRGNTGRAQQRQPTNPTA